MDFDTLLDQSMQQHSQQLPTQMEALGGNRFLIKHDCDKAKCGLIWQVKTPLWKIENNQIKDN